MTERRSPNRCTPKERRAPKHKLIDLFSGCGGMTLGFRWDQLLSASEPNPVCRTDRRIGPSPFVPVWTNDFNRDAIETYRTNFDPRAEHTVLGPIEEVLQNSGALPRADVVIGGPPCQGFSLLNKQRSGDARRQLWWHFMEVVERTGARVVVMENVPQLLNSAEFVQILQRFRELGFEHLMAHVLGAANYGVPQTRKRVIVMASRTGPIALPIPTHLSAARMEKLNGWRGPELQPWRDVREALRGLRKPHGTEIRRDVTPTNELQFGRSPTAVSLERYAAVPPGGNRFDLQANRPDITPACWIRKTSGGTDLFGRLWWDRPSVTIRTEFFKPEKGRYLHPDQDRPITHREAARLQSFPDGFRFSGTKIEIAKQIGNAVPPLLSYSIAARVRACLEGKTSEADMARTVQAFRSLLGEEVSEVWNGTPITTR